MAMTGGKALFIDTNILIFATDVDSPFHDSAIAALTAAAKGYEELFVSCQVLREYLASGTRNAVERLEEMALNINEFRKSYTVLDDDSACLERLVSLSRSVRFGGKQVHDANIVACMMENGISSLLTHNIQDFKRFEGMIDLIAMG